MRAIRTSATVSGLMLALGLLAAPGATRAGILISGTTVRPVGDPVYAFDFKLTLGPGELAMKNDFLTILSVPDLIIPVFSNIPDGWKVTSSPVNGHPTLTDLTFTYRDSLPIDNSAGTTPLFLGDFVVITNDQVTSAPPPPQLLQTLSFHSVASTPGNPHSVITNGSITPMLATPEPGTIVLMGLGVGGLLLWQRRRRRVA
jgi:hypothetical protein